MVQFLHHNLLNLLDNARKLRHNLIAITDEVSPEVDFALTSRTQEDGSTLVALAGEVDLHRVPALADALQAAAGGLVVDLREVTFLDSATLALLVHEHRRLRAAGQELTVLVGEHTPTTVFALTGIERILTIRSVEPPSSVAESGAG